MYMYMYMMKSVLVLQAQTHGGGRPTGTIWIHWTLWWRLLPRHPVSPRPQHGLRITTRYPASPPTNGGVASYMAKTFHGL